MTGFPANCPPLKTFLGSWDSLCLKVLAADWGSDTCGHGRGQGG